DSDECAETRAAVEHWYDAEAVPPGYADAQELAVAPPIANRVDADFGDVRLLGLDVPATAHRGDQLALTWTFEVRGRPAPGWKVFAHVEAPNKTFISGDHLPPHPFEWIEVGKVLRYTTTVAIPRTAATGRHTVLVGLFRGSQRAHATAPHAK